MKKFNTMSLLTSLLTFVSLQQSLSLTGREVSALSPLPGRHPASCPGKIEANDDTDFGDCLNR